MVSLSKSQVIESKKFKIIEDINHLNTACMQQDKNKSVILSISHPNLIISAKNNNIPTSIPEIIFRNSSKKEADLSEKHLYTNMQTKESIQNEGLFLIENHPTQSKEIEETPHLCRVCYEEGSKNANGDGGKKKINKLVNPCQCIGSCKYIHENCLKTWISNSFIIPIEQSRGIYFNPPKPKCELCDWEYLFKFSFYFGFPPFEKRKLIKSAINYLMLYLLFVFSCAAVIYLVVTSIASLSSENKKYLILGLACFSLISLIVLIIREIKVLQLKNRKMILSDWGFFNYEEYSYVLASDEKDSFGNKTRAKRKEELKWESFLEERKWYTNLIYRRRQVMIMNSKSF